MNQDDKEQLLGSGFTCEEASDSLHGLTIIRCPLCHHAWTWPVGRSVTRPAMEALLDHLASHME